MTTDSIHVRGRWQELPISFDVALDRLQEALKKEGFGIVTHIDLRDVFATRLGVGFRRYRILGACNPSFAHAALLNDPRVGLLLPCNVVLYETDDGNTVLGAVDPMQTLGSAGSEPIDSALQSIAREVGQRLANAIASVAT